MILEALGRVDANWYPIGPWFHPPPLCNLVCSALDVMRRKASLDSLSFGSLLGADTCGWRGMMWVIHSLSRMLWTQHVQSSRLSKKKCFPRFRLASKAWISKEAAATFAQSPSPRSHFCKYQACGTVKQRPLSNHLSQAPRSVWTCPWLWAAEVDESLSVISSIDTDSPTNLTSCPCPDALAPFQLFKRSGTWRAPIWDKGLTFVGSGEAPKSNQPGFVEAVNEAKSRDVKAFDAKSAKGLMPQREGQRAARLNDHEVAQLVRLDLGFAWDDASQTFLLGLFCSDPVLCGWHCHTS